MGNDEVHATRTENVDNRESTEAETREEEKKEDGGESREQEKVQPIFSPRRV